MIGVTFRAGKWGRAMAERDSNGEPKDKLRKRLILFSALVGALAVPPLIYFVYDLVRTSLSPCESIYQQAAVSLKTKVKFVEAEGEVHVGKDKVDELSERAQMTALNLKACCTVLDAGRLDPEQFLQCKGSARQYQADLDRVVTLVKQAVAAEAEQLGDKVEQTARELTGAIEAATATSQAFNQKIVEVKQDQAIAQLKVTAPAEVEVEAQEKEPNSDLLNTNAIELDTWITGAITDPKDDDFYTFTTPGTHRDWYKIELENRSTTLKPNFQIYNADKAYITRQHNGTRGANLSHNFVAAPNTKYYIQVRNYDRGTAGAYLLRVRPYEAYDAFEPNHTILEAKTISLNDPIEAGIMDAHDNDFYRFETGDAGGAIVVTLENRSTTLKPSLQFYNGSKSYLGRAHNGTAGADVTYQVNGEPNAKYYVQVRNYDRGTYGDYTLTVKVE